MSSTHTLPLMARKNFWFMFIYFWFRYR